MNAIYKYTYNNEIIYIGKTDRSLETRIDYHAKEERFQPYLDKCKIEYFETKGYSDTKYAEKTLIRKYNPILNVIDKLSSDYTVQADIKTEWKDYNDYITNKRNQKKKKNPSKKIKQTKKQDSYVINIDNIKVGDIYTYPELCEKLGDKTKPGQSKICQIKHWRTKFDWINPINHKTKKPSKKIQITEIFEIEKEYIDNRKNNGSESKSKIYDAFCSTLVNIITLHCEKINNEELSEPLIIGLHALAKELGIKNVNYNESDIKDKNILQLHTERIYSMIPSYLKKMQKDGYIIYKKVSYKKGDVPDKNNIDINQRYHIYLTELGKQIDKQDESIYLGMSIYLSIIKALRKKYNLISIDDTFNEQVQIVTGCETFRFNIKEYILNPFTYLLTIIDAPKLKSDLEYNKKFKIFLKDVTNRDGSMVDVINCLGWNKEWYYKINTHAKELGCNIALDYLKYNISFFTGEEWTLNGKNVNELIRQSAELRKRELETIEIDIDKEVKKFYDRVS